MCSVTVVFEIQNQQYNKLHKDMCTERHLVNDRSFATIMVRRCIYRALGSVQYSKRLRFDIRRKTVMHWAVRIRQRQSLNRHEKKDVALHRSLTSIEIKPYRTLDEHSSAFRPRSTNPRLE